MEIKNINDGINWRTIPKAIKDEFSKNGHIREETHRRNDKGVMEVTYGEIMRPIFANYKFEDSNFYVNLKFIEHFEKLIDLGIVFDEDLNVISKKNIKPFHNEYLNGFNKGYSEFENTLKKDSPLFGASNEHIVYKVYSRIINEKKGSFPMYLTIDSDQTDLEKRILKEKGLQFLYKLNKEKFFNSGFEGGEFYKAWEIILNNPTVFEPIFTKNSEVETNKPQQPEPLDLSDSKTTDKIAYLYESGIIDFLHKKDGRPHTVNSIASLLSAITGIKQNTIQSAINPFINTHSTSKSKPAESTLTKAKSKIIDLGF